MSENTLNEAMLAKECLLRLGEKNSVLHQAADVLSQVAHSAVGLGEVLQDYAHQTTGELQAIIQVAERLTRGNADKSDKDVLLMTAMTLKAACTILNSTPAAMLRNKAENLGENKITRIDVVTLADRFAHAPDVVWLLEKENCGQMLAALITEEDASFSSQETLQDTTSLGGLPN